MKKTGSRPSAGLRVSASELAQMGVCERLVVFEQRYGARRTPAQRQAIWRGQHAHRRFYRNGHLDLSPNGSSATTTGIASVLYGWLKQTVRVALWPIRWCIARWAKGVEQDDDY